MSVAKIALSSFAAWSTFVLVSGCNAILGNEDGKLGTSAQGSDASDATVTDGSGGGQVVFDGGANIDAGFVCPQAKKACEQFKACVDPGDVNFGCGNPNCIACDDTNAVDVKCAGSAKGSTCKALCKPGFADCNNDGACETDLSKPTSCGACGKDCTAGAAKLCARISAGQDYDCVATCPVDQECPGNAACVDKQNDPTNCGGCGTICPKPTNGTSSCELGKCGQGCNTQDHLCGTTCYSNGDATHCGAECQDCNDAFKRPPHTVGGSCQGNACVWDACAPGWADCNGDLSKGTDGDGCEIDIWTSSAHCGNCGTICSGPVVQLRYGPQNFGPSQYCCNGACIDSSFICAIQEH